MELVYIWEFLRFIIVLGVLIFVHELGHFLIAKRSKIFVERFSLGFGPRVWGFKWGETDYCISAIPFGGFVKMAGQEDWPGKHEESEQEEEKQEETIDVPESRKFYAKPVLTRIAVVFFGPLMNFVLAYVIFYVIFVTTGTTIPAYLLETKVGTVKKDSPAEKAGLQFGDKILKMNGKSVSKWQDVLIEQISSKEIEVVAERAGREVVTHLTPQAPHPTSAPVMGVEPYEVPLVEQVEPGGVAEKAGLQKGDVILAINDESVDRELMMTAIRGNAGVPMTMEIMRGDQTKSIEITPSPVGHIENLEFMRGKRKSALVYREPQDDEYSQDKKEQTRERVASASQLRNGDIVMSINGEKMTASDAHEFILNHPATTMTLEVERMSDRFFGGVKHLSIPVETGTKGFLWIGLSTPMKQDRYGPLAAFGKAFKQTYNDAILIFVTVKRLVTGEASLRLLAGPVGIYRLTQASADAGIVALLQFVALISVNLAILNLLPIPALDGGHILFSALEGARGKPVDVKYLERMQQVGVALLCLLMLLVTWNDIVRILHGRLF